MKPTKIIIFASSNRLISITGFTLTEMLAVVMIIALIAGTTGGIYLGSYQKRLVESSARQLLLTAKYARVLAVDFQRDCQLHLDTEKQRFFLSITSVNEETGQTEEKIIENQYAKPTTLPEPVVFEEVVISGGPGDASEPNYQENIVTFSPHGTARPAVIRIGAGRIHYTAIVSAATGRMTIHDGIVEPETEIQDLDL